MSSRYALSELVELEELVTQVMKGGRSFDCEQIHDLFEAMAYRTSPFDWNNWKKGLQGLKNAGSPVFLGDEIYDECVTSSSFEEFNQEELEKLLLMIHRVNRFSDGYYDDQIENGVVKKILDRLLSLQQV